MKIEMHEVPIRDVVDGYLDSADNGVVAYHGRLDVRPRSKGNLSIKITSVMRLSVPSVKVFL